MYVIIFTGNVKDFLYAVWKICCPETRLSFVAIYRQKPFCGQMNSKNPFFITFFTMTTLLAIHVTQGVKAIQSCHKSYWSHIKRSKVNRGICMIPVTNGRSHLMINMQDQHQGKLPGLFLGVECKTSLDTFIYMFNRMSQQNIGFCWSTMQLIRE